MSKAWASGSTTAWRKTRAGVLARDQGRCMLRRPGCTGTATQVHHTIGKKHGDRPAWLIAACIPCNQAEGDPTRADPAPRPWTAE